MSRESFTVVASTPMTFDVNAFTPYAVADASAESAVRELCAMISDVLAPSVASELESAKLHTEVASLLYRNGCFNESVVHNLIAIGIYKSMYGEEAARVKMVLLNLGMAYIQLDKREDALRCMNGAMALNDANSDVYLNACFYACVLNA